MTSHREARTALGKGMVSAALVAIAVALLAGCGGGEGIAPDATLTQAEKDRAALNRATELNKRALASRVAGEGVR